MDIRNTKEYKEMGYAVVSCPVCERETLDSYWICECCGWEYDGVTDENGFSAANGATVGEYRMEYWKQYLNNKLHQIKKFHEQLYDFSAADQKPENIIVTRRELCRQLLIFGNPNFLLRALAFGKNHPDFEKELTRACMNLQTASSFAYIYKKTARKPPIEVYENLLFDSRCGDLGMCRSRLIYLLRRQPEEISNELVHKIFEKFCAVKRYTLPMIANTEECACFSLFRQIILFVIEHDDCPEVKAIGSYRCPDLPGMSECDVDFDY